MSGVKVVNETDQDIILYEGTGGVYRIFTTIPKGKKLVLKVDPNETYREYRCGLPDEISSKRDSVLLTPSVFAEFTHVTIKWNRVTDSLSYVTMKKDDPGLLQRFLKLVSWKREHVPSDGGGGGGDDGGGGGGGGSGGGGDGEEGCGSSDSNVPRRGGALDI